VFNSRKAKKADVLSHWYTLVDHFNISCKDFYAGIERELTLHKVPDLKISRVIFSEGGFLSANREYLRMKRERLVFDICAAPFGTSYFFSMRFAELPQGAPWWRWIPIVGSLALIGKLWVLPSDYGIIQPIIGTIVVLVLLCLILSIIGKPGEETYYRQDTRLMYLEVVDAVVKQKIAEFTSAHGIHLLNIRRHSPLMDDLYRTTHFDIQPTEMPAEVSSGPVAS
jgi:hypothetical protein